MVKLGQYWRLKNSEERGYARNPDSVFVQVIYGETSVAGLAGYKQHIRWNSVDLDQLEKYYEIVSESEYVPETINVMNFSGKKYVLLADDQLEEIKC